MHSFGLLYCALGWESMSWSSFGHRTLSRECGDKEGRPGLEGIKGPRDGDGDHGAANTEKEHYILTMSKPCVQV